MDARELFEWYPLQPGHGVELRSYPQVGSDCPTRWEMTVIPPSLRRRGVTMYPDERVYNLDQSVVHEMVELNTRMGAPRTTVYVIVRHESPSKFYDRLRAEINWAAEEVAAKTSSIL